MELVVRDIQLLGTLEQVELAKKLVGAIVAGNGASTEELLSNLRRTL